jgi:hypothetical protein
VAIDIHGIAIEARQFMAEIREIVRRGEADSEAAPDLAFHASIELGNLLRDPVTDQEIEPIRRRMKSSVRRLLLHPYDPDALEALQFALDALELLSEREHETFMSGGIPSDGGVPAVPEIDRAPLELTKESIRGGKSHQILDYLWQCPDRKATIRDILRATGSAKPSPKDIKSARRQIDRMRIKMFDGLPLRITRDGDTVYLE